MLLPYQRRWLADQSLIKIAEKSRRIGFSWADAADSALEAAKINGVDTFYIGYNIEMAQQYIKDVAYWAKAYQLSVSDFEESVIEENGRNIFTYTIHF
jgi:phage FluMu gp28-like protein